jgi:hypothetical protein
MLGCVPAETGPGGGQGGSGTGGSGTGSGGSGGNRAGGASGSNATGGSAGSGSGSGGASAASGGSSGATGSSAGGNAGTGGAGSGGSGAGGTGSSTGGASGSGGSSGTGGSAGTGASAGAGGAGGSGNMDTAGPAEAGGNPGGLTGADKICQDIASEVGAGQKTWRAFLSAIKGPDGQPAHAIDRIGSGPWYDRNGRLIAMNRAGLLSGPRPAGTAQAIADLANERGQTQKQFGDNHDVITGSNKMGMLNSTDPTSTCSDWTSAAATASRGLMCGHSWSRVGSQHWLNEHSVPGCGPGVNLRDNTVMPGNCIGCNGGYGAIYCFALTP